MNNKTVELAATLVVGTFVLPIIVGGIGAVMNVGAITVDKMKYKKKIKDGLKDGSIVEIDGQYYVVTVDN